MLKGLAKAHEQTQIRPRFNNPTLEKIRTGDDPGAIAASWTGDEAKWRLTRAKYLLY